MPSPIGHKKIPAPGSRQPQLPEPRLFDRALPADAFQGVGSPRASETRQVRGMMRGVTAPVSHSQDLHQATRPAHDARNQATHFYTAAAAFNPGLAQPVLPPAVHDRGELSFILDASATAIATFACFVGVFGEGFSYAGISAVMGHAAIAVVIALAAAAILSVTLLRLRKWYDKSFDQGKTMWEDLEDRVPKTLLMGVASTAGFTLYAIYGAGLNPLHSALAGLAACFFVPTALLVAGIISSLVKYADQREYERIIRETNEDRLKAALTKLYKGSHEATQELSLLVDSLATTELKKCLLQPIGSNDGKIGYWSHPDATLLDIVKATCVTKSVFNLGMPTRRWGTGEKDYQAQVEKVRLARAAQEQRLDELRAKVRSRTLEAILVRDADKTESEQADDVKYALMQLHKNDPELLLAPIRGNKSSDETAFLDARLDNLFNEAVVPVAKNTHRTTAGFVRSAMAEHLKNAPQFIAHNPADALRLAAAATQTDFQAYLPAFLIAANKNPAVLLTTGEVARKIGGKKVIQQLILTDLVDREAPNTAWPERVKKETLLAMVACNGKKSEDIEPIAALLKSRPHLQVSPIDGKILLDLLQVQGELNTPLAAKALFWAAVALAQDKFTRDADRQAIMAALNQACRRQPNFYLNKYAKKYFFELLSPDLAAVAREGALLAVLRPGTDNDTIFRERPQLLAEPVAHQSIYNYLTRTRQLDLRATVVGHTLDAVRVVHEQHSTRADPATHGLTMQHVSALKSTLLKVAAEPAYGAHMYQLKDGKILAHVADELSALDAGFKEVAVMLWRSAVDAMVRAAAQSSQVGAISQTLQRYPKLAVVHGMLHNLLPENCDPNLVALAQASAVGEMGNRRGHRDLHQDAVDAQAAASVALKNPSILLSRDAHWLLLQALADTAPNSPTGANSRELLDVAVTTLDAWLTPDARGQVDSRGQAYLTQTLTSADLPAQILKLFLSRCAHLPTPTLYASHIAILLQCKSEKNHLAEMAEQRMAVLTEHAEGMARKTRQLVITREKFEFETHPALCAIFKLPQNQMPREKTFATLVAAAIVPLAAEAQTLNAKQIEAATRATDAEHTEQHVLEYERLFTRFDEVSSRMAKLHSLSSAPPDDAGRVRVNEFLAFLQEKDYLAKVERELNEIRRSCTAALDGQTHIAERSRPILAELMYWVLSVSDPTVSVVCLTQLFEVSNHEKKPVDAILEGLRDSKGTGLQDRNWAAVRDQLFVKKPMLRSVYSKELYEEKLAEDTLKVVLAYVQWRLRATPNRQAQVVQDVDACLRQLQPNSQMSLFAQQAQSILASAKSRAEGCAAVLANINHLQKTLSSLGQASEPAAPSAPPARAALSVPAPAPRRRLSFQGSPSVKSDFAEAYRYDFFPWHVGGSKRCRVAAGLRRVTWHLPVLPWHRDSRRYSRAAARCSAAHPSRRAPRLGQTQTLARPA